MILRRMVVHTLPGTNPHTYTSRGPACPRHRPAPPCTPQNKSLANAFLYHNTSIRMNEGMHAHLSDKRAGKVDVRRQDADIIRPADAAPSRRGRCCTHVSSPALSSSLLGAQRQGRAPGQFREVFAEKREGRMKQCRVSYCRYSCSCTAVKPFPYPPAGRSTRTRKELHRMGGYFSHPPYLSMVWSGDKVKRSHQQRARWLACKRRVRDACKEMHMFFLQ